MPSTPTIGYRTRGTQRGVSVDPDGLIITALGWKDNLASFTSANVAGANVPAWAQMRDGIYAYSFSASLMNELWLNFHIDHDYAPGTVLYPHVHFVPSANASGVVRWGIEYTYAKGHGQQKFPATTTVYVEATIGATDQYLHIISEVVDGDAIPADEIEVDGVVMTRIFRDAGHVNDTYPNAVFGIYADLHYQTDRLATIAKAPDFYL